MVVSVPILIILLVWIMFRLERTEKELRKLQSVLDPSEVQKQQRCRVGKNMRVMAALGIAGIACMFLIALYAYTQVRSAWGSAMNQQTTNTYYSLSTLQKFETVLIVCMALNGFALVLAIAASKKIGASRLAVWGVVHFVLQLQGFVWLFVFFLGSALGAVCGWVCLGTGGSVLYLLLTLAVGTRKDAPCDTYEASAEMSEGK